MNRLAVVLGASLSALCLSSPASAQPAGWRCEVGQFGDGTCDCGCGVPDSDCPAGRFVVCERSGCTGGQVPWEHQPETCMSSACGDGWRDEARGEACDDGEALAGGGCNRDCSATNDGWTCGDRADQCVRDLAPPTDAGTDDDAGPPAADASAAALDAGSGTSSSGGCSVGLVPGIAALPLSVFALGLLALRRRRLA